MTQFPFWSFTIHFLLSSLSIGKLWNETFIGRVTCDTSVLLDLPQPELDVKMATM